MSFFLQAVFCFASLSQRLSHTTSTVVIEALFYKFVVHLSHLWLCPVCALILFSFFGKSFLPLWEYLMFWNLSDPSGIACCRSCWIPDVKKSFRPMRADLIFSLFCLTSPWPTSAISVALLSQDCIPTWRNLSSPLRPPDARFYPYMEEPFSSM